MENAWPWLQGTGPLASARGRGIPRFSGLGLPQSSCTIMDKLLPSSTTLFLLQPFCLRRPSTLQGRDCLSLYVVCSLLHHAYVMTCSTALTTVFFLPTAASSQHCDEEKKHNLWLQHTANQTLLYTMGMGGDAFSSQN